MSRPDRGFLLFLVVVLVALFYELFPRHGGEPQAPTAAQAPAGPASSQPR